MIRQLMHSIREYKKASIATPLFVVVEALMEIVIPTLMALLIDAGIEKKSLSSILWIGLALIACAAFSLISGILAGWTAAAASSGFAKNLRHDIFYKVQTFSFSNIDRFSTGSIITRLTTDVTNVQNAYQMLIRLGVRAPVMILFALLFSFRISPKMSLIFVGVIPVLAVGLFWIMFHVHPIFVRAFDTYDRLNNVVQENLRGIRVVKSFTREKHEVGKFAGISKSIYNDFCKAEKRLAFNMPLMQFCLYASMILLSWFGAKEILASGNNPALGLSTGDLTGLITYAMQILMSLMMLSMVFVMFLIAHASAGRIAEILNEKSDLQNGNEPLKNVKDGSIAFENVSFRYAKKADKPVLDHVSLSISPGQTVGILGGTGSSKSSLVQLIPRLYDVTDGCVKVGGEDVRAYDIAALRSQVAMVLQKNVLFSGTIRENLRWGNENATDEEIVRACELAQADGFIREFPKQYDAYIDQGGSNVSGGQKQRLCIARALLKKPKILILDDSTSAVDTRTDELIREAFRNELPGMTKLIIAQRISSVQDADKIIVMNDGRISAVGTHAELLKTSPIYREVYESQNERSGLRA